MRCYEKKIKTGKNRETGFLYYLILSYTYFLYISHLHTAHSTTYMAWHFLFPFSRHFFKTRLSAGLEGFFFDILINMEISLSLTQLNTQFKFIFIYYTFRTTTQNGSGWIKILQIYLRRLAYELRRKLFK